MTALLISLALAAAGPAGDPVPILVGGEGGVCRVAIQRRRYALPADDARFAAHLRVLTRSHRRARLALAYPDTPYRCVGAVLLAAQRIGLPLGFFAEPPPGRR